MTPNDLSALPPTLTVPQTAKLISVGRDACYAAIRRGELPSLRIGRTIRVPTARLLREVLGITADMQTAGPVDPAIADVAPTAKRESVDGHDCR